MFKAASTTRNEMNKTNLWNKLREGCVSSLSCSRSPSLLLFSASFLSHSAVTSPSISLFEKRSSGAGVEQSNLIRESEETLINYQAHLLSHFFRLPFSISSNILRAVLFSWTPRLGDERLRG